MKIFFKSLTVLSLLLVFGCEKLDEVPYSFLGEGNLYKTEADADKALLGVYRPLNMAGVDDLWFFLALSGPSENVTTQFKGFAQSRFTSVDFVDTDPQVGIWTDFYQGINRANLFIENVPMVGLETTLEEQKIAEARFLRAFYYFYLGHIFGGVPLHLESTKSFSDEDVKKPRATLEEVYAAVEDDLLYAEDKLPTSWDASNAGRATSGAAKALLGKLYLTMAGKPLEKSGMYEKAATKLKEVTSSYSLLPNFNDVFSISNEFNSEIIFARPDLTNGPDGTGTVLTFFAGAPGTPYAWGGGQYQIGLSEALYESYDLDDTRRDVTFLYSYTDINGFDVVYDPTGTYNANLVMGGPRNPNGIPFGKLKDPMATTSPFAHGNDIIYLRYADVLLMIAEAENEMGKSLDALPYLNEIRTRAGLNDITTTDQNSLRAIIKQERKWELAGEYTEYFDLQRWGDLQSSMADNPDSQLLGVSYNPKYELYPIPISQLDSNEKLTQNPGY